MRSAEEQLRGALHRLNHAEPEPLDAQQIIAGARVRRARNRARIVGATGALAVVALAGVLLPQVLSDNTDAGTARAPQAGPQAGAAKEPAPGDRPAAAREDRLAATIGNGRWCLAGATPACRPLTETSAEVELGGTPTRAVLAPVGTERIEPVRAGDPVPRVFAASGPGPRLVALQPLEAAVPIQAVGADGRVLATW